jgi:hypothetical protein
MSDYKEELDRLVTSAMKSHNTRQLALGFLRYERLRKMNPMQFAKLHAENITGRPFDFIVDESVVAWRARA